MAATYAVVSPIRTGLELLLTWKDAAVGTVERDLRDAARDVSLLLARPVCGTAPSPTGKGYCWSAVLRIPCAPGDSAARDVVEATARYAIDRVD
jgi:hypothetical protein